jgi:hypothetical protein
MPCLVIKLPPFERGFVGVAALLEAGHVSSPSGRLRISVGRHDRVAATSK